MKHYGVLSLTLAILLLSSLLVLPLYRETLFGSNLFLLAIVIIMLFGDTTVSLTAALAGGFVFDSASALPFGTYLFAYIGTLLITRWLFRSRFTNRSFIAFVALVAFGTLVTDISAAAWSQLGGPLDTNSITIRLDLPWLQIIALDAIRAGVIASIMYLVVRLFGRSYATLASHEF